MQRLSVGITLLCFFLFHFRTTASPFFSPDTTKEIALDTFWSQYVTPGCSPVKKREVHGHYREKDTLIENGETNTFILEQAAVFPNCTLHLYSRFVVYGKKPDSLLFRVNGKDLVPHVVSNTQKQYSIDDIFTTNGWAIDTGNVALFSSDKTTLLRIPFYDIDHSPGTSPELDLLVDLTDLSAPSLTILCPWHRFDTFWSIGDPDGDGRLDAVSSEHFDSEYDFRKAAKDGILDSTKLTFKHYQEYGRLTIFSLDGGPPRHDKNEDPFVVLYRVRYPSEIHSASDYRVLVLSENWPSPCE